MYCNCRMRDPGGRLGALEQGIGRSWTRADHHPAPLAVPRLGTGNSVAGLKPGSRDPALNRS